jgi:hypothetical protein
MVEEGGRDARHSETLSATKIDVCSRGDPSGPMGKLRCSIHWETEDLKKTYCEGNVHRVRDQEAIKDSGDMLRRWRD